MRFFNILKAIKQQQIPPEVQEHALTQLLSILKKFNIFQWKLESLSFEILFEHILPKIRCATQNLTLSNEIATISLHMAPFLAKFSEDRALSSECISPASSVLETQDERHHKNVHQLKFKMKIGARKKTSYDKGKIYFLSYKL